MARIQQSIEVGVPVHTVYHQLTQFEDYPRFMQDVETVHRLDDTHLHWSTRMSNRSVEWDAEITEQQPDRCIAWHNTSGPTNAGMVEVQPVGADKARVTLTIESEPDQVPGSPAGNSEASMAQRLEQDLARFKQLIEARGAESDAAPTSSYAAGSEGWSGAEDPEQPVLSSTRNAAMPTPARTSDDEADDGRYSVAEEQNFDQQSDQARRVAQMPQDAGAPGATEPAEAMAKSLKHDAQIAKDETALKQAIERAVPPSE